MTKFKAGDRVRYTNTPGGVRSPGSTGTVRKVNALSYGLYTVTVDWDRGLSGGVTNPEYLELISPTAPLVGPAPKVEPPVYQAPFKASSWGVLDDRGRMVLTISDRDHHSEPLFAQYVAEALNARVLGEN